MTKEGYCRGVRACSKALSVPLFSHRLELSGGAHDADAILAECVAPVVERVTRKSMAA